MSEEARCLSSKHHFPIEPRAAASDCILYFWPIQSGTQLFSCKPCWPSSLPSWFFQDYYSGCI